MKKTKILKAVLLIGLSNLVFAQEVQAVPEEEGEQIALPNVTTVVTADNLVAGSDALPDFLDVLHTPEGSGDIVPVLPDLDGLDNTNLDVITKAVAENSIFAEGKFGGGYPLGIYGDFKIYRLSEKSPFQFSFLHDSANGYSRSDLSEGYNDSTTLFEVEKGFGFDKTDLNLDFWYENKRNGFQNKAENFTDINQNSIFAKTDFDWKFAPNFVLGTSVDFDFYNRFSSVANLSEADFTDTEWTKAAFDMDFSPKAYFVWENNGFKVDYDITYRFDKGIDVASHRVQTGAGFSWKNDVVKISANGDLIFGNLMNSNNLLLPFDLGVDLNFPVKFASRQFGVSVTGGMDSYRKTVSEYEKLYKFTGLTFTPSEVSDWFGKLELSIPVKTAILLNSKIEFRTTAMNNCLLQPVYSGESATVTNGFYSYAYSDPRSLLITAFDFNYSYGIFNLGAGWHSNWISVPANEAQSAVSLSANVQSKNAKWNSTLLMDLYFGEDGVEAPVIGINGMFKVSDSFNVELLFNDLVNLFGGEARKYAGQYISRGGSATVMIKFFF